MLKLIQLGLTFTDAEGNLPRINGELCVWQFNFRCDGCLADALRSGRFAVSCKQRGGTYQQLSCMQCSAHPPASGCLRCREFRLSDDMYAQDSIELLKQSGIDFAQNETRGIDVRHFGELLTVSGVVLNEDVSAMQL